MPHTDIPLREDIYQTYHPFILEKLNRPQADGAGPRSITLDPERAAFMFERQSCSGQSVLDIGANQGFMSIEAALRGAQQIDAFESNPVDGAFMAQAASALEALQALKVHPVNFAFDHAKPGHWDCVICLNVLHHVGRYFDAQVQDLAQAKSLMASHLRRLLGPQTHVWFQLGFNWQGNPQQPMFAHGTKREMSEFVVQMLGPHGRLAALGIYNPERQAYEEVVYGDWAHPLWQRMEGLGEFANRPLYLIESLA